MAWANWISAVGTGIEVIGFAILAFELQNTNTSSIMEAQSLQAEKADVETITVHDADGGDTPGVFLTGGKLGKLIDNLNQRQADLSKSKRLIFHGLLWTGFGILIQLVGSIGQAVGG